MASHRETEAYARDFANFLQHTREKEILFAEIVKRAQAAQKDSVLDVGCGSDPKLARELLRLFDSYTGVEINPQHASAMSKALGGGSKRKVIHGRFPEAVPMGSFDFLVCCHALPARAEDYEPFIAHALSLTESSGRALVITYDSETSEWRKLLDAAGLSSRSVSETGRLERIRKVMRSRRNIAARHYTLESTVFANSLEEMMEALAFVYGDGIPESKERFLASGSVRMGLESYRRGRQFVFPFVHHVFEA